MNAPAFARAEAAWLNFNDDNACPWCGHHTDAHDDGCQLSSCNCDGGPYDDEQPYDERDDEWRDDVREGR